MKHSRFKKNKSMRKNYVIFIVFFIIVLCTFKIFIGYSKKANPKIKNVVNMNIDKMINTMINEYSLKANYKNIKDVLIINKNINDEIVNIDYNLENLYDFLRKVTIDLKDNLANIENCNNNDFIDKYLEKKNKKYILYVPLGVASDNVLLSNLGPKIPIEIKFMGSIITGINTKVKDYGINNSLIEVYVTININILTLTPVDNSKNNYTYNILVASKIIEGHVPQIYGGVMENKSNLNVEKVW